MILRRVRPSSLASVLALVYTCALAPGLVAQELSTVEALAPVLAAEDARRFDDALFRRALASPDSLVRRTTAMSVGRVGDRRGTALLVPLLADPDSTVRVSVAFALGLLRDSSASTPLIERLRGLPALDGETAAEAVTALAKIGGRAAGDFFAALLRGQAAVTAPDPQRLQKIAALEAWRLGRAAPVQQLLPLTSDTAADMRWRAIYSLGRLRAPEAGQRLLAAMRDAVPLARANAVRALTRDYADSARLDRATTAELVLNAVDDQDAGVRINAMRSLGTFGEPELASRLAPRVVNRLDDALPNVRVQAAATLGQLGGPDAVAGLRRLLGTRAPFAVLREALLGLARSDSTAFRERSASWRASGDWRERAAVAEGEAICCAGGVAPFLRDADGRVVAAALQAWAGEADGADSALVAAARPLLSHRDAAVRSIAADVVARAADPRDVVPLAASYRAAARDSFPEAALSVLGGLAAIARSSPANAARVNREFLHVTARPTDYLQRGWAQANWPAAAELWGPGYPIETGRTLQDYREILERYVVNPTPASRPHVFIETEQRGTLEIELLGPDAPLTVANFLRLVNRRFFDGNRWHRVVPNFVVQDGDPRGDGWGGPGGAIRDEINRRRYDDPVLGMALSGPDTGSSQWFINLSPQPHLDGTYTVFGAVVGSTAPLMRITQGDVIRTIRR